MSPARFVSEQRFSCIVVPILPTPAAICAIRMTGRLTPARLTSKKAHRSAPDSRLPPPPDAPISAGAATFPQEPRSDASSMASILGEPGWLREGGSPATETEHVTPDVPGFVILGECGRGGMGLVYLAEQVGLGRALLSSFSSPSWRRPRISAQDSEPKQRLWLDSSTRTSCKYSTRELMQVVYIVQEYVGGGSLERSLAGKPQAAMPAAVLVATLARAVAHAHGK